MWMAPRPIAFEERTASLLHEVFSKANDRRGVDRCEQLAKSDTLGRAQVGVNLPKNPRNRLTFRRPQTTITQMMVRTNNSPLRVPWIANTGGVCSLRCLPLRKRRS
jgi:hypothetical protein